LALVVPQCAGDATVACERRLGARACFSRRLRDSSADSLVRTYRRFSPTRGQGCPRSCPRSELLLFRAANGTRGTPNPGFERFVVRFLHRRESNEERGVCKSGVAPDGL